MIARIRAERGGGQSIVANARQSDVGGENCRVCVAVAGPVLFLSEIIRREVKADSARGVRLVGVREKGKWGIKGCQEVTRNCTNPEVGSGYTR